MTKILDLSTAILQTRRNQVIVEDGTNATSGGDWTNYTAASCTVTSAAVTGAGAALVLTTNAGTASDLSRGLTTKGYFPAANLPLFYEARINIAQANTNQANVYCGFSSTFATGLMQASSAGPATSFTGCGFYLTGAQTTWGVIVSNGSTQTLTPLNALNSKTKAAVQIADGNWHTLRIDINPTTSTYAEVIFYIDGVVVYVIPEWTYTSGSQMGVGEYLRTGATATNAEVLNVDYHAMQAARIAA